MRRKVHPKTQVPNPGAWGTRRAILNCEPEIKLSRPVNRELVGIQSLVSGAPGRTGSLIGTEVLKWRRFPAAEQNRVLKGFHKTLGVIPVIED